MAKVRVLVTSALATYMNNEREVTVEADSVRELLNKLANRYGSQLSTRLLDESGNLRRYINIYINDRNIRGAEIDQKLNEGDEVLILPAVSGGEL
ncbi:MAG: MoaD family protein [Aigarchaeota archaeon]|nr:MoaD family protein [Aigarchaeota archaeon]MDW8092835.1 MoaD family protein [Nitrososphaerota archaeon]